MCRSPMVAATVRGTAVIALRALLAIALLGGFYVLAFGILVLLVALLVALVPSLAARGLGGLVELMTVAIGLTTAFVAVGRGVFAVSGASAEDSGSIEVTADEAPTLWSLVTDVASRADVGRRTALRVRLTAEANAAITEEARLLGFLPGQRCVSVGLPLLAGLSVEHLRAILHHEFGHCSRRHTQFGALVYRGGQALEASKQRLRRSAGVHPGTEGGYSILGWWFFGRFTLLYNRVALAVRRRQEFEADAEAARVVGSAVTADALLDAYAVAVAWAEFLTDTYEPARAAGLAPADPFAAFRLTLDDPRRRYRLDQLKQDPPRWQPAANDTHPSLARRLEALESRPYHGPVTSSASTLLIEQGPWIRRLADRLHPPGGEAFTRRPTNERRAGSRATEPVEATVDAEPAVGERTPGRPPVLATEIGLLLWAAVIGAGFLVGYWLRRHGLPEAVAPIVVMVGALASVVALVRRRRQRAREAAEFDPRKSTVVRPVGRNPQELCLDEERGLAYIAAGGGQLVVVDLARGAASATIELGQEAANVALCPAVNRAFVSVLGLRRGRLVVVDTTTNRVVANLPEIRLPRGMAVAPSGRTLYVTGMSDRRVWTVDTATLAVTGAAEVGSRPCDVVVSPDGRRLYVANFWSDTVSVVAVPTLRTTRTIPVGGSPRRLALHPDGARLYVTCEQGMLVVVETNRHSVVTTVQVGESPEGVAVSYSGDRVYVADPTGGALVVLDARPTTPLTTVAFGHLGPIDVAPSATGEHTYVVTQRGTLESIRRI